MTCQYCRAQNDIDAHRCSRCGRRTMERIPVQMTAAVPELETVEMPAPAPIPLRPQLVTEPPPKRPTVPSCATDLSGEPVRTDGSTRVRMLLRRRHRSKKAVRPRRESFAPADAGFP